MNWRAILTRRWAGYLSALAFTALVTSLIAIVRQVGDVSNISMLYLLAVLASAVLFGSGPAILASFVAFLEFDVLFIEPLYTLTVADSSEWVALALLLVTGVITGQLAAALRNRAREAEAREREAVVLYDVVRLMADWNVSSSLEAVAGRLNAELGLEAVVIDVEMPRGVSHRAQVGTTEALAMSHSAATSPGSVLREGAGPTAERAGSPGRWIRIVPPRLPNTQLGFGRDRLRRIPIGARDGTIGSLILVKPADSPLLSRAEDRLLSAVVNQIWLAFEWARLREEATEAEVLRRTDELRSALLSAVSHDLRTPLSAIIASAGSLLQEDVVWPENERREFATAIVEEAQRLNRLVGNLLDLSRIEAGSLRPEKGWYDTGALIDDVVGRLRSLTSRHKLIVEVAEDLPPVMLDYVEIDAVLSNLIENAVKYTPPGTELRVSARKQGYELQVTVEDRGPGIPADALRRLFEPFYRVRGSGLQPKGTGLGLAVAAGLVAAHGGRILAENRQGGGVRFTFYLPLTGDVAEPAVGAGQAP